MNDGSTVIVIGSGLGGLSSAVVAAARGHKVTVIDKNDWTGGKASVLSENGFRFDMGPTILTVPSVLKRVFSEAGEKIEDWMNIVRLDPQWRCFYDGGDTLDLLENIESMAKAAEAFSGKKGVADGYRKLQSMSENLHGVSNRFYFWRAIEDIRDTMNIVETMNPATLRDVLSLRMGRSVAGTIRGLISDDRVAQMLDHFVQYVGSSPFAAPAVLCSIAHMQSSEGVWYPMGGTREVAVALRKLGEKLGVTYQTGVEAERIIVENDRVIGESRFLDLAEALAELLVHHREPVIILRPILPHRGRVGMIGRHTDLRRIMETVFLRDRIPDLRFVGDRGIENGEKGLSLGAIFPVGLAAALVPDIVAFHEIVILFRGIRAVVARLAEIGGKELHPFG
jgi:phytoene desaturase